MAWRIADSVERGEIDNRTRDRMTGKIWLCGREAPVYLELSGNPCRDLAGHRLRFLNPKPKSLSKNLSSFAEEQTGVVGDMTAARRVKVLDIPDDQLEHYYTNKIPMPYHWGNCLYLEWHSVRNGRVVIEATDFVLEVDPEPAWQMSEAEEAAQQEANGRAMVNFMEQLMEAASAAESTAALDDDDPQSELEAEADDEAARMDLLMDRITARLERERGDDPDAFERIMEEERERLRKERGEPEPQPLSPEEEAERERWIEAANAAAEEAANATPDPDEFRTHPLVEHCQQLGSRLHKEIKANGWLPEGASQEHPLQEIEYGIQFASAKLAGALNGRRDEWPPEALFAGDSLVRLKKARNYLRDALRAHEAAEAEKLADPAWLLPIQQELDAILQSVNNLIDEVRTVLKRDDR